MQTVNGKKIEKQDQSGSSRTLAKDPTALEKYYSLCNSIKYDDTSFLGHMGNAWISTNGIYLDNKFYGPITPPECVPSLDILWGHQGETL